MTLKEKHEKFIEETSLMLWVVWDTENYNEADAAKVNDSLVTAYFENPMVKEHLTCVDRVCKNIHGCDVRVVAKNYVQHFKLVHNIKPIS